MVGSTRPRSDAPAQSRSEASKTQRVRERRELARCVLTPGRGDDGEDRMTRADGAVRWFGVLVTAALVLAGCGSSDDSGKTSGTGGGTSSGGSTTSGQAGGASSGGAGPAGGGG